MDNKNTIMWIIALVVVALVAFYVGASYSKKKAVGGSPLALANPDARAKTICAINCCATGATTDWTCVDQAVAGQGKCAYCKSQSPLIMK